MQKKYCYEYPRPALTVDMILFSRINDRLSILLIQRKFEPFISQWAFPGGFVEEAETAEQAAERELEEETGLKNISLTQFYTASELNRDPRHRTVSIAYYGFIQSNNQKVVAGDDASNGQWFEIHKLPPLAFDHNILVKKAYQILIDKIKFGVFGLELMPPEFELVKLADLYHQLMDNVELVEKYIQRLQEENILVKSKNNLWEINKVSYMNVKESGFIR